MSIEQLVIAQPYASALLDLAGGVSHQTEDAVLSDLQTINKIFAGKPDFEIFLKHPAISSQTKKQILTKLFEGNVQELTMRMLGFLNDKRRLELLPAIESQYRLLLARKRNITQASLTSAEPITSEEVEHLRSKLCTRLGLDLRLNLLVDKNIIAGLVLKIGDQVFDGSVSGKLKALRKELLAY